MNNGSITLTPAQLDGIANEIAQHGHHVKDIRVRPINGSTVIVTLDAGWGTASFYINRNGRIWQAGMGETA